MASKLYVLIRGDLSPAQQGVQAGHAVAEWMRIYWPMHLWFNGTLIYVTVRNQQWLQHWKDKLDCKPRKPEYAVFVEPDLDNEYTALACFTEDDKLFSKLPLWNPIVS